jgi:hypothetical protein
MAMIDMDLCAKYKAQQNIPHNSAALSFEGEGKVAYRNRRNENKVPEK